MIMTVRGIFSVLISGFHDLRWTEKYAMFIQNKTCAYYHHYESGTILCISTEIRGNNSYEKL